MQKIIPHLWFDTEAQAAVDFYLAAFKDFSNTNLINTTTFHDTPSGDSLSISFQLAGYEFMAINGGPYFKINPSISFMLNFDPSQDPHARKNLDTLWNILSEEGTVLMPLGEYPFSKHYGWIQDKYGVSWQLILTNPAGEVRPFIMPSLLFTNEFCGKAQEATDFYISLFKNSHRGNFAPYPAGMEPDKEGTTMFTDFELENQWFVAMDSAHEHHFIFNEALSFLVRCDSQEEIDYFWDNLSFVPESEQCGWLKDKYGVSWQIVPTVMDTMIQEGTSEQIHRVTQAFLKMKKFDIVTLEAAYNNK